MLPKRIMKLYLLIISLTLITSIGYTQNIRLSDIKDGGNNYRGKEITEKTGGNFLVPALLLWPLNPMVVAENSKAYFALTKEVSLILPRARGKIGFEYSYVFRTERNNHLRLYADYFIPLGQGDFAVVLLNVGGGYFTDTKKSGLFPQLSMSILAPTLYDNLALTFYIKVRQTFMFRNEEANIFDASTGIGAVFFF